jgi:5-bromo-4-chloroindolyl phosphate hydrolysis protein
VSLFFYLLVPLVQSNVNYLVDKRFSTVKVTDFRLSNQEQAFLRQQLEVERQRVSALAQVEAENRCIEAAVVQAVEQKQESEAKVLGLQQEVISELFPPLCL